MRDRYPLELLSPKWVEGSEVLRGHSSNRRFLDSRAGNLRRLEGTLGDQMDQKGSSSALPGLLVSLASPLLVALLTSLLTSVFCLIF